MRTTQGSFEERSMTAHYKDLREIYARRMDCHGNGLALMHPISGDDCSPVSCGYFDRNGDWNFITRLCIQEEQKQGDDWIPLEYAPKRTTDINIVWQPKTALGVQAMALDASGDSPDNLPGGADAHIKYSTNSKFGAVLMTMRPVTLYAYNDERLFNSWLAANRSRLYARYGAELKRYGLWIVTRTYNAPAASINVWTDGKKDTIVSLKAKASMLGELGETIDWKDNLMDKDWCHYNSKSEKGLVVFLDGIEVSPMQWWKQSLLETMRVKPRSLSRSRSVAAPQSYASASPSPPLVSKPRSRTRAVDGAPMEPASQRPQSYLSPQTPAQRRHVSESRETSSRRLTLVGDPFQQYEADDDVLRDAGVNHISRSSSLRRGSYASTASASARSSSLRRTSKSVTEAKPKFESMEGI